MHTEESLVEANRQRIERARRERARDPIGFDLRERKYQRTLKLAMSVGTAFGVVFVFFVAFPHAKDFADYVSQPGKAWRIPLFFVIGGLGAYLLKTFSLVVFGTAELVSGCVSAYLAIQKVSIGAETGWAAWTLLLGLLYLVAKGVENLDKGFNEPVKHNVQEFRSTLRCGRPVNSDGA
jgi:heme/copper-type cytochrome/quinol oxidase subunit 3